MLPVGEVPEPPAGLKPDVLGNSCRETYQGSRASTALLFPLQEQELPFSAGPFLCGPERSSSIPSMAHTPQPYFSPGWVV